MKKGPKLENEEGNRKEDFQDSKGRWLEVWPTVDAVAACASPECRVFGVEVRVTLGRNLDGVFRSSCGWCGGDNDLFHPEDGPAFSGYPGGGTPEVPRPGKTFDPEEPPGEVPPRCP